MLCKPYLTLFLVLALIAVGCISGTVTDENGDGIGSIKVTLTGPSPGTTTTDVNGNYWFLIGALGDYEVSADLSEYLVPFPGCVIEDQNVTLEFPKLTGVADFSLVDCLPGACCLRDGTCLDGMDEDLCFINMGTYQGGGSDCSMVVCIPEPTGACCLTNGNCADGMYEEDCSSQGTYQGDGSLCSEVTCPEPTGACCLPDETCQVETQSDCELTLGGTYHGDNIPCELVDCATTGACCIGTTCYEDMDEGTCFMNMGTYQGNGSTCDPDPCAAPPTTGACCIQGICYEDMDEGTCFMNMGTYQGNGSTCDPDPCTGP